MWLLKLTTDTGSFRVLKITEKSEGYNLLIRYRPEREVRFWKFTFWVPVSYKLWHVDMNTWKEPLIFEKEEDAIECIKKYKDGYYSHYKTKEVVYEEW